MFKEPTHRSQPVRHKHMSKYGLYINGHQWDTVVQLSYKKKEYALHFERMNIRHKHMSRCDLHINGHQWATQVRLSKKKEIQKIRTTFRTNEYET